MIIIIIIITFTIINRLFTIFLFIHYEQVDSQTRWLDKQQRNIDAITRKGCFSTL